MNTLPALKQLILGDFRERIRSYSFLLILLGTMFFGYLVVTDQYTVRFGEYRGEYNGAWEGTLMAVSCSIMLTIFGFYLVKNSIRRDRLTNVGQILASGSVTKLIYLASKALSNCLVLLTMVGVLAAGAVVMALMVKGEIDINLWYLISPFILIAVPAMILVAALAVLFESMRWLRGSLGNVLYVFLAEGMILMGLLKRGALDIAGVGIFTESAKEAIQAAFPGVTHSIIMGFVKFDPAVKDVPLSTFAWTGVDWTAELLLTRLGLIIVAGMAVLLAVPFFDRFDPALDSKHVRRAMKHANREREDLALSPHTTSASIATLLPPVVRFNRIAMVRSEFKLMTKGYHWFWYVIALGLLAAQSTAPFELARMYLVPASVIWYIAIWSGMGSREHRCNTEELLFSSPHPLRYQFLSAWISGVAVALMSVRRHDRPCPA